MPSSLFTWIMAMKKTCYDCINSGFYSSVMYPCLLLNPLKRINVVITKR